MRTALPLLLLLATALPAAAAPPPVKPGAALAALRFPACDDGPDHQMPLMGLQAPLEKGDWKKLEGELEGLHASFERNPACERRMLRAFLSGFALTEQLPAQLDRWVAARPSSWTAYTIRGTLRMFEVWHAYGGSEHKLVQPNWQAMRGPTDRAVADLERAIELHPRALVAHTSLIQAFQPWQAQDEIEAAFRRAKTSNPLSVELLVTMLGAVEPRWGGTPERAEAIVAEARRLEKQNPAVARVYGFPAAARAQALEWGRTQEFASTMPNGERQRAILLYTKALLYGEPNSQWHYRRARLYQEQGDHEAAVVDSDFALAADKSNERFWVLKIWSLGALARYEESLAAAREGQQHVPKSMHLRYSAASTLYKMGRYAEAAEAHRAILALAKSDHDRHLSLAGLGSSLVKLGRYAEAVPYLEEAVEHDNHALTVNDLAEALWQSGRRAEAVPVLERFLALTERKPWAEDLRMRAQERIDTAGQGAQPPARARRR